MFEQIEIVFPAQIDQELIGAIKNFRARVRVQLSQREMLSFIVLRTRGVLLLFIHHLCEKSDRFYKRGENGL